MHSSNEDSKEMKIDRIDDDFFHAKKLKFLYSSINPDEELVGVSFLTDPIAKGVRTKIDEITKTQYFTPQWDFLKDLVRLNSQQHISPDEFDTFIKKYIMDNDINIDAEKKNDILKKITEPHLSFDIFIPAVNEVFMNFFLNNVHLMKYAKDFDEIYKRDQAKVATQYSAVAVLDDIVDFTSADLVTFPKPSISFKQDLFVGSNEITTSMKYSLIKLLNSSDNMSIVEFEKEFKAWVNKYEPKLNKSIADIQKKITGHEKMENYETYKEQLNDLIHLKESLTTVHNASMQHLQSIAAKGIIAEVKEVATKTIASKTRVEVSTSFDWDHLSMRDPSHNRTPSPYPTPPASPNASKSGKGNKM